MKDPDSFVHKFESDFLSFAAKAGVPTQPSPSRFLPSFFGCRRLGHHAHADALPASAFL